MHRVTSMENWEKKEGKVNLKCVFNPPLVGIRYILQSSWMFGTRNRSMSWE